MARLKDTFKKTLAPALQKTLNLENVMQIPEVKKISFRYCLQCSWRHCSWVFNNIKVAVTATTLPFNIVIFHRQVVRYLRLFYTINVPAEIILK